MNELVQIFRRLFALVLPLALTAISYAAAPQSTKLPDSRPAKVLKKVVQPSTQLRKDIEEYRSISKTLQEAWSKKLGLENQLNEMKRRRNQENKIFGQRELEELQAQLHSFTDDVAKLNKRRRQLAESILNQAPAWRKALVDRQAALDHEARENPEAAKGPTHEAERLEITRRLTLLDSVDRESRTFGPMFRIRRGGPPDDERMHPMGGPMGMKGGPGMMGGGQMGPGPGRGLGVRMGAHAELASEGDLEGQIERLEREQLRLKAALLENETQLQSLKNSQALLRDSSELGGIDLSEKMFGNSVLYRSMDQKSITPRPAFLPPVPVTPKTRN